MHTVLIAALLVRPVSPASVPSWADSVFRHSIEYSAYDYASQVSPGTVIADCDGDGLADVVIEIKARNGLQRGLAVIHHMDGSVHILGAGRDVGDGNGEIRQWRVIALRHHRVGIRVSRGLGPGGLLVWDGQAYRWVPAP